MQCRPKTRSQLLITLLFAGLAIIQLRYALAFDAPPSCAAPPQSPSPPPHSLNSRVAARTALAARREAAVGAPRAADDPQRPLVCAERAEVVDALRRLSQHMDARRNDCTCVGPHNGLVCDRDRFWAPPLAAEPSHLAPAHANVLADVEDAASKTPVTPWLTIGSLKFTANDYLDWFIFSIFFSDPAWAGRGTFLETGGSNGVYASNSLFFERSLNWSGLLIEPTPCALCEIPLNRRATAVHAALGTRGGPASLDVSLMRDFCPSCPETLPWSPVRTGRLQELAAAAGYASVDFLSLDVEGFGEAVLADIAWGGAFAPSVIAVECLNDLALCVRILEGAGYNTVPAHVAIRGAGAAFDVIAWRNNLRCR